jgi:hypothetical protein
MSQPKSKTRAASSVPSRQSFVETWWVIEVAALVLSIGMLSALLAVLFVFNNRPLSDWPVTFITLNAVISIVAVFSKSALLLPLTNGLSQVKWLWYRDNTLGEGRSRKLINFQRFDDASRGPWGALQMLFHVIGSPLAIVGCLTMATSFLFDPFVQQTVTYPSRTVTGGTAEILRTNTYTDNDPFSSAGGINISLSTKAAVYDGLLLDDMHKASSSISPTCNTGNCTFKEYTSLGICSHCLNTTSELTVLCPNGTPLPCDNNITYAPNGLMLLSNPRNLYTLNIDQDEGGILNASYGPLMSDYLQNLSVSWLTNFTMIGRDGYGPAMGFDCVLSVCARKYSADVQQGNFSETIEQSFVNKSLWTPAFETEGVTITIPGSSLLSGHDEVFRMPFSTQTSLQAFLAGNVFAAPDEGGMEIIAKNNDQLQSTSDWMQALYEHGVSNVPDTLERLAISLTNHMRQQGVPATGTATKEQTFIKVRWAWLILPLILEALAVAFLTGAIVKTVKGDVPAWKASALALVFHGPAPDDARMDTLPRYTVGEMESSARLLSMRLKKINEQQFRFDSTDDGSPSDKEKAKLTRWQRVRHVLGAIPGIFVA